MERQERSCRNCLNVSKLKNGTWVCEEYGFFHLGVPADCTPPNDEACERWTDDPKKANSWEKYI